MSAAVTTRKRAKRKAVKVKRVPRKKRPPSTAAIKVYRWRQGSRRKGDAQPVGERLEWLEQRLGREPTPRDIVDDALSPRSPFHAQFNWDNDSAADVQRLSEAGHLQRCISVVVIEADIRGGQAEVTERAYEAVTKPDGTTRMVGIERIMNSREMYADLCRRAALYLKQAQRRFARVKELKSVFGAIDDYVATIHDEDERDSP